MPSTTAKTPTLVPVEMMPYEDFTWMIENGFDPFKTPVERELEASRKLAAFAANIRNAELASDTTGFGFDAVYADIFSRADGEFAGVSA